MALENNTTTPIPYQPGKTLELKVVEDSGNLPLPQSVTAVISKTYEPTMSSVMEVTIGTKSGPDICAILKLYDRRFGTDLRKIKGNRVPQTSEDESTFQSLVRRGDIVPILRDLEEEKKTAVIPLDAWHYLDDTPEGREKYEVALWQECNGYFDCETEAYALLKDLQGRSIPRLYAHVSLMLPGADIPQDLLQQPDQAQYMEVKGILLERIPGCSLWDLPTSTLAPSDPDLWPGIVQSAVNAAHDINKHGLIMDDCAARNVVIDQDSQSPFIIDLAQCRFKHKLIEMWMNHEDSEDGEGLGGEVQDWDPDVEYWEWARGRDNPGAIGSVMAAQLLRLKNLKVDIEYPDYDGITHSIQSRKGGS